jgi:hypothetical protein
MNASIQQSNSMAFVVDLDLYTDGDPELRSELIVMMIDNIRELQQTLLKNDFDIFRKVSHKVKPTIIMLNNKELTDTIEAIAQTNNKEKITQFNSLCKGVIKGLEDTK